jgi:hypothetical protein
MAAVFAALALASGRAVWSAARLRKDLLAGTPEAPAVDPTTEVLPAAADVPAQREPDPEPTTQALPHREPGRTKTLPMPVEVDTSLDDDDDDGDEPPGFHLYRPSSRP